MVGHISTSGGVLLSWLYDSKIQPFGAMKNSWKGKVVDKRVGTDEEEKKSQ